MKTVLLAYVRATDALNRFIGRIMMYGLFVIMAVLLWSSATKATNAPALWTLESAQFAMIAYFFLGGPYAIQMGSHVRMDLFYETWSAKRQALVDAITVLCLIVYLAVLLWGAIGSTAYSLGYFGKDPFSFFLGLLWGSENVGTLERSRTIWRPYLWPIKVVLCVGIVLMLLQAISELIKDVIRANGEDIT